MHHQQSPAHCPVKRSRGSGSTHTKSHTDYEVKGCHASARKLSESGFLPPQKMETCAVSFQCLLVEMEKRVRPKSTKESKMEPPPKKLLKGRPGTDRRWSSLKKRLEHGPSCRRTPGFKWTGQIGQSYHGNNNPRSPNRQTRADTGEWRMKTRVNPSQRSHKE